MKKNLLQSTKANNARHDHLVSVTLEAKVFLDLRHNLQGILDATKCGWKRGPAHPNEQEFLTPIGRSATSNHRSAPAEARKRLNAIIEAEHKQPAP